MTPRSVNPYIHILEGGDGKMKKLFVLAIALMVISSAAFAQTNLVVNGDFSTGDETGWTRWNSPWGGGFQWDATQGFGQLSTSGGSFGWYQVVKDVPVDALVTVSGEWKANNISWLEFMLYTVAVDTDENTIKGVFDSGPASDIAFKKDAWGMNPPTSFDWQAADLSKHPTGNQGSLVNQGWVVVGLKLGAQNSAVALFDNVELSYVPEPGSMVALMSGLVGLGGLVIRRKR